MSFSLQYLANALIGFVSFALAGFGFAVAYRTHKFFNIAYGSFATAGGYAVYQYLEVGGLSLPILFLLSATTGAVLAAISEFLIFSPIRKKGGSSMVLMLTSLGVYLVFQGLFGIFFSNEYFPLNHPFTDNAISIGSVVIGNVHLLTTGFLIITTILWITFLNRSVFGKSIKAVGDDPEVARLIGLPTERVQTTTAVVSGAIAGILGALWGLDTGVETTMGFTIILKSIASAIVGGIDHLLGSIPGALLLSSGENLGVAAIPAQWKDAISFGILILFLLFRPRGLLRP